MSDTILRLTFFLSILIILIMAEILFPKKKRIHNRKDRWITNGLITLINTASVNIVHIAIPLIAIVAAIDVSNGKMGLFNIINFPIWIEIILTVIILDFIIWGQHLLSHKIPFVWRFHRMHHTDRDLDVTTAVRFHPFEIIFSMFIKITSIYILGASAIAVIIFEIMLNGMAMFNHANLRIPFRIENILRKFIVTPDLHRIHHSIYIDEHNKNFGFSLSIWDKIFKCYLDQPRDGHKDMKLGLKWQNDKPTKLGWSLWIPFKKL
ncbi:sterol desaturase family protein [Amylibacter sp.]|jgi:sterol desaturase/sphingolipid hydroxylase (fatty acid hydroxylase superfamily)|nr:sterol desaturase family protein [Amylibacter sp.]MDC0604230.1 sterol desaturase family protein [Amylibacter sp.]MDG1946813.1 sterol desaturase family protein [Amylibacter sp.]MDG2402790.1 sterol desaturase family protein [Amylibacter sp.]